VYIKKSKMVLLQFINNFSELLSHALWS